METVKSFHKLIYYHTRSSIKTIALKVQNNSTPFPQKGSLGNSCKDAGGHFNPGNKNHGDVNAAERHEGDFGNIVADNQGIAKISVVRYKKDLSCQVQIQCTFYYQTHITLIGSVL